jgi:hypothetical protein
LGRRATPYRSRRRTRCARGTRPPGTVAAHVLRRAKVLSVVTSGIAHPFMTWNASTRSTMFAQDALTRRSSDAPPKRPK